MKDFRDFAYLEMAYSLAEKALGHASPNPYVGAVIVKNNIIVGHGYHEGPGRRHAEIMALEQAGPLSQNSTIYITLEPCVHWGRTPPCVDRLLKAKPRRVVVSALDPNPLVFKKGIRKLREAGIEVSAGLDEEKNIRLNEAYIKYITKKIPFITLKAALSLDGKMATKKFDSQWISSPETREYFHLLRGEYDALMVGINTLLKDDPLLTVRHPNWRSKNITRVILDSHLRFPLKARILSTLSDGKIFVLTQKDVSPSKKEVLEKKGVEVVSLQSSPPGINLKEVFSWLGKNALASVLVEGGGRLATALLEEKLADKIFLAFSPQLIGGEKAVDFFGGKGADYLRDSLFLKKINYFQLNDNLIVEGYF